MLCEQCHERDETVYLVTPDTEPPSQEEQHLCQPCFEEIFRNRAEILEQLRKAVADAAPMDGASSGWTSYTPDVSSDKS
jgi:protein-arginine kinase activator protein McsA